MVGAVPKGLLIGGKWIDTDSKVAVENPATGQTLAEVADASPAQGIEALDAAVAASAEWAATDPRVRGEILRKAFELLTERAEDIALLMTLEMGKPLAEARGEVTYGSEFFRWFSEEAVRIAGRYSIAPVRRHPVADHEAAGRTRSTRSPRGISRWPWAPARSGRHWPPAAPW